MTLTRRHSREKFPNGRFLGAAVELLFQVPTPFCPALFGPCRLAVRMVILDLMVAFIRRLSLPKWYEPFKVRRLESFSGGELKTAPIRIHPW